MEACLQKSDKQCDRVQVDNTVKYLLKSIQLCWCTMSWTVWIIRNLRRSASGGHFSIVQHWDDDGVQVKFKGLYCAPQTHFAPRHWIVSNCLIHFWVWGFHTWQAYSSIGNTNARKHLCFESLEQLYIVRRRKLRILVALAAIVEQWSFHDNVEFIWSPKYLTEVCQFSWEPLST